MSNEHTPGPWDVGTDRYSICDMDGCIVLRVSRLIPPHEAERLVNLLVAAPDLLDHLVSLLDALDRQYDPPNPQAFPPGTTEYVLDNERLVARAAIAKATQA